MFSKKFIIIHICFICIIGILSSSAVVFATSNQNINPSSDYATTDSIAINYNNYSHPANQNSNINHSYTVKSSKNIDTYEPSLSKNIRNNKYQLAKSSNNITKYNSSNFSNNESSISNFNNKYDVHHYFNLNYNFKSNYNNNPNSSIEKNFKSNYNNNPNSSIEKNFKSNYNNNPNSSIEKISNFDLEYDNSFSDVQTAINNVGSDSTVYLGNSSFLGLGCQIKIKKNNFILDGSNPNIPESYSILDANGLSRVLYITGHDVTLRNLIILNGNYESTNELSAAGAGALYTNYGAFIDNCIFINNFVSGNKEAHGGGLALVETTDCRVQNSQFINNTIYSSNSYAGGAGLFSTSDNTIIHNCSFTNCKSYSEYSNAVGGGLQIAGPEITGYVKNCKFTNNSCESINDSIRSHGGAFCINSPQVIVSNSIFTNNSAAQGGATTLHSNCTLNNCSFINKIISKISSGISWLSNQKRNFYHFRQIHWFI